MNSPLDMSLYAFVVQTISSASLIGLILWLTRNLIQTRLKEAVKHEFEVKLESVRDDATQSQQRLQAQLDNRKQQIEALRTEALSRFGNRQEILLKKKLESLESVWLEVIRLAPARNISGTIRLLKFEGALAATENNQEAQDTWKQLLSAKEFVQSTKDRSIENSPQILRLYVPQLVWSLYSAYVSIVMYAVFQAHLLELGLNKPELLNEEHIIDLAKTTLPDYASYIDEHGLTGIYYLLDNLETLIFEQIQDSIHGEEQDDAGVELASRINEKVNIVEKARVAANSKLENEKHGK